MNMNMMNNPFHNLLQATRDKEESMIGLYDGNTSYRPLIFTYCLELADMFNEGLAPENDKNNYGIYKRFSSYK